MEWRRGLFRIWIVLSASWILIVAAHTSPWILITGEDVHFSVPEFTYTLTFRTDTTENDFQTYVMGDLNKRSLNPDVKLNIAHNLLETFKKDQERVKQDRIEKTIKSLSIAFLPPLIVFVMAYLIVWIKKGFLPVPS